MQTSHLVLIGNFGAGNFGDELILAGFLKRLSLGEFQAGVGFLADNKGGKQVQAQKITVLTANSTVSRRFHGNLDFRPQLPTGWRSFWRLGWLRSLRVFARASAIIFPGGGLFTDLESWRAIFIWGLPVLVARILRKPVYFYGQSVGPFRGALARNLTRRICALVELIEVRERKSLEELRRLEVPKQKFWLGRDSALYLSSKKKSLKRRQFAQVQKRIAKVLFALRSFPRLPLNFWSELGMGLKFLAARKVQIYFTEFGQGDRAVFRGLLWNQRLKIRPTFWALPQNPERLIRELGQFDLVVGMRLHALIAASLAGVPSLGFAYAPKIRGCADKVFPIEDFQAQEFKNWILQTSR